LAEQSDPAVVAELRTQIDAQQRVAKDDPNRFIQLDERFHRTLAEAANKASAWKFLEGLKSQMDRVRFLSFSQFPMAKLITQHKAVVDGIAAGNIAQAEDSIRVHLNEILIDLPKIQRANPEFFDEP